MAETETGLWVPDEGSDRLLFKDPIAAAKVANPFPSHGEALRDAGMLPPDLTAEQEEGRAAAVMAEAACEDDRRPSGEGARPDDDVMPDDEEE